MSTLPEIGAVSQAVGGCVSGRTPPRTLVEVKRLPAWPVADGADVEAVDGDGAVGGEEMDVRRAAVAAQRVEGAGGEVGRALAVGLGLAAIDLAQVDALRHDLADQVLVLHGLGDAGTVEVQVAGALAVGVVDPEQALFLVVLAGHAQRAAGRGQDGRVDGRVVGGVAG